MAKQKKLTLSVINKANSALNELKVVRVLGDYEVRINTKFRKTLIRNVLISYFTILQDLKGRDNVTEETIMNSISLLNTLILREFSDVPIPSINNVEELIEVSNALLDTGILEEVFIHFPQEELNNLSEELKKASKNIGELMGEIAIKTNEDTEDNMDGNIQ